MKCLLIYNEIPENTTFFAFDIDKSNPQDKELLRILEACQDCMGNSDPWTEEMNLLINILSRDKQYCEDKEYPLNCYLGDREEVAKSEMLADLQGSYDKVFCFHFVS